MNISAVPTEASVHSAPDHSPRRRSAIRGLLVLPLVATLLSSPASAGADSQADGAAALIRPALSQTLSAAVSRRERSGELVDYVTTGDGGQLSFMSLSSPVGNSAAAWVGSHADLLAANSSAALRPSGRLVDEAGVHQSFTQYVGEVPVYHSRLIVHMDDTASIVQAVTNGLIPRVTATPSTPTVAKRDAIRAAKAAAPRGGQVVAAPSLAIYDNRLVWLVDIAALQSSNRYFVNARGVPGVLHVENRMRAGLNREVYDAQNTRDLPGVLVLTETSPIAEDNDASKAYTFTGATYRYFNYTFGLDSFDGEGAKLISSVNFNYGYDQATWDGSQMIFGAGMVTMDITAHELTHAVDEYSADLEYRGQSGALNESFSDIFGVMADYYATGVLDWTIGGGSSIGVLRDMSNPEAHGQPSTLNAYVSTCGDEEGVHTNSGIPNKAFYNIASAIGTRKAEQIFYKALTDYLTSTSKFNETRAATIEAATQLYGDPAVTDSVRAGWDAVAVDGHTEPPAANCGCSVNAALSGADAAGLSWSDVAATRAAIYRFRDSALSRQPALSMYWDLYADNKGSLMTLILLNAKTRNDALVALQRLSPGLQAVADGKGKSLRITREVVVALVRLRNDVIAEARRTGDWQLERAARLSLPKHPKTLIGKSYAYAMTLYAKRAQRLNAPKSSW